MVALRISVIFVMLLSSRCAYAANPKELSSEQKETALILLQALSAKKVELLAKLNFQAEILQQKEKQLAQQNADLQEARLLLAEQNAYIKNLQAVVQERAHKKMKIEGENSFCFQKQFAIYLFHAVFCIAEFVGKLGYAGPKLENFVNKF